MVTALTTVEAVSCWAPRPSFASKLLRSYALSACLTTNADPIPIPTAPKGPRITKPIVPPTTPAMILRRFRRFFKARRSGGGGIVYVLVNRVTIGVAGRDMAWANGTASGGECVPREDVGIVTDALLCSVTRTAVGVTVGTWMARILWAGSSSTAGPRYSAWANLNVSTIVFHFFTVVRSSCCPLKFKPESTTRHCQEKSCDNCENSCDNFRWHIFGGHSVDLWTSPDSTTYENTVPLAVWIRI